MARSPYEDNILTFVYVIKNQPELFTAEDRTIAFHNQVSFCNTTIFVTESFCEPRHQQTQQ